MLSEATFRCDIPIVYTPISDWTFLQAFLFVFVVVGNQTQSLGHLDYFSTPDLHPHSAFYFKKKKKKHLKGLFILHSSYFELYTVDDPLTRT